MRKLVLLLALSLPVLADDLTRLQIRVTNERGKPVDRAEWVMSPPTLNAYYNPQNNEIVFPAGILQPPFFDPEADDALNYGGIGSVIGHEMTHGFDDQGAKFDPTGNLANWWSEADLKAFDFRKIVDNSVVDKLVKEGFFQQVFGPGVKAEEQSKAKLAFGR